MMSPSSKDDRQAARSAAAVQMIDGPDIAAMVATSALIAAAIYELTPNGDGRTPGTLAAELAMLTARAIENGGTEAVLSARTIIIGYGLGIASGHHVCADRCRELSEDGEMCEACADREEGFGFPWQVLRKIADEMEAAGEEGFLKGIESLRETASKKRAKRMGATLEEDFARFLDSLPVLDSDPEVTP